MSGSTTLSVIPRRISACQNTCGRFIDWLNQWLDSSAGVADRPGTSSPSSPRAKATLTANQGKKDITQELEKSASLRQQGILSVEEFQQMKGRILSNV